MLAGGRLTERAGGRDLSKQAGAVAAGHRAAQTPISLRDPDGGRALILEFAPLPGEIPGFPGMRGAVILVREACDRADRRLG